MGMGMGTGIIGTVETAEGVYVTSCECGTQQYLNRQSHNWS